MNIYEGKACFPGEDVKIAIIVAKYNKTVTENLLKGAVVKLKENNVADDNITVVWVPGAFELPTLAQRFALDENYQAVICLGCVIKGETSHDEHINRAVSMELARIGSENGIPVIFGLLTCNTNEQAVARSGFGEEPGHDKVTGSSIGNKGTEAAEAALEMLNLFELLPPIPDIDELPSESIMQNARRYAAGEYDMDEDDPAFDGYDFDDDYEEGVDDDDIDFFREERPEKHSGKKKSGKSSHSSFKKPGDKKSNGKKGNKKSFKKDSNKHGFDADKKRSRKNRK